MKRLNIWIYKNIKQRKSVEESYSNTNIWWQRYSKDRIKSHEGTVKETSKDFKETKQSKNKKSDSESLEERDTASKMSKVDWVDKSKE